MIKKFILYYFIFLASLFAFLSSGVVDSQDGFQYVEVARNIYYKGEPTGPVFKYNTRENIFMATYIGQDGKTYTHTGLGFSLAMVPAAALTDLVYKIYNVSPPVNFPLENDWLILLTTSFTNSFFGALLGIVLFLYLLELGLSKKQAIILSLAGMFTTNLIIYTKHSFAHMMFVSTLVLAFYLIKKYSKTLSKKYLIFAGLSYGLTMISYNQSFLLTVPALFVYIVYLSQIKVKRNIKWSSILRFKPALLNLLLFILGTLPFVLIYIWFENLREIQNHNLANPVVVASKGLVPLLRVPAGVFIEGLYGQLFSIGRSIFIYSPILLLLVIFWHKIKKVVLPEIIAFAVLSTVYLCFYASQFSIGTDGRGVAAFWHGESSWGPRYLLPLIPFAVLVAGVIYTNLSQKARWFIFYPILLIGFYINILGVITPYQVKYAGLEHNFYINNTEYNAYTYSNLLPRYNPVLAMTRNLVKSAKDFPKTFLPGQYNVNFFDGIDFSFFAGLEKWRVIEGKGFISFDNPKQDSVNKISFRLINHPIEEASDSAVVNINLNGKNLLEKDEILLPREEKIITLNIEPSLLKEKDNLLVINSHFQSKNKTNLVVNKSLQDPEKGNPQILSLKSMVINDAPVNLDKIYVPYVSDLGPKMTGVNYNNWGGDNKDPWKTWQIHTQTYERIPDFWWLRNLYYWDIPKSWILGLLIINLAVILYSGYKLKKLITSKNF